MVLRLETLHTLELLRILLLLEDGLDKLFHILLTKYN